MLEPREPIPERTTRGLDPILAFSVLVLALVALGLILAAFLAVYTYSTPGLEAPLVIGLTLAFGGVVVLNVVRLGVRRLYRVVAGR